MKISFSDVQRNISEIANRQEYTIDVLYELMAAYGRSASSITKLRNGTINLAEVKDSVILQRGVVYFKVVAYGESLPSEIEKLEQDPLTQRYNPRFLIATDLKTFAAKDTKKGNTLEIDWVDIDRSADFFYGWTGDEVTDEKTEAAADRRAADKMKELYEEIEKVNSEQIQKLGQSYKHDLNVFFTRLLFCFFAEDTKVFSTIGDNVFTNTIKDFTLTDGSDLDSFLTTLFESLDVKDKSKYTSPFSKFPYVNGSLFDNLKNHRMPKFNAQARKHLLDCGNVNWAEITPDIFGSMFQSIARRDDTQHFTSVPNILKTIEPLFLDELREELDNNFDNLKKLEKLLCRISKIKVFDPACGSGNFLVVAYRELRKLEHGIIERLYREDFKRAALRGKLQSKISLNNFYGIEIGDFECEIATLSMLIAKHQMNIEFEKQFGKEIKLIPLKDKANIEHGNAARLEWQKICPNIEHRVKVEDSKNQASLIDVENEQTALTLGKTYWEEIYLIGNPPYQGAKLQSNAQRDDLAVITESRKLSKNIDYISIWLIKGAEYVDSTESKLAFVSTNSVCQGEQVAKIWPYIFDLGIEIQFAHTSFKWSNSAAGGAGVYCIVIALANKSNKNKYIFSDGLRKTVMNINAYLVDAPFVIVNPRKKPLSSSLPEIQLGSSGIDGGHLVLSKEEKELFEKTDLRSSRYIKKYIGGADLINGNERYCLWIEDNEVSEAKSIELINDRIKKCKQFRILGGRDAKKAASVPHRFFYKKYENSGALIIPMTSTQRRNYIPITVMQPNTVASNGVFVAYGNHNHIIVPFSLISSRMHMTWMRMLAGKLKTDYRYSNTIVYNNFPVPNLSSEKKLELTDLAQKILLARENHTEKTLAEMYDPDKMPDDLRDVHHQNDLVVDRLYRQKPYKNDEERLVDLFKLYEEIITKEEK